MHKRMPFRLSSLIKSISKAIAISSYIFVQYNLYIYIYMYIFKPNSTSCFSVYQTHPITNKVVNTRATYCLIYSLVLTACLFLPGCIMPGHFLNLLAHFLGFIQNEQTMSPNPSVNLPKQKFPH